MAYRKRTLRSMTPVTRKVARLLGELESVGRRLKNAMPEIQSLELDSRALTNAKAQSRIDLPSTGTSGDPDADGRLDPFV